VNTIGYAIHKYTQYGTYLSSLQICDDEGCCVNDKNIPIKTPGSQELPNWKEVSPFK
jgi:hypothetical protein